eukprot:403358664
MSDLTPIQITTKTQVRFEDTNSIRTPHDVLTQIPYSSIPQAQTTTAAGGHFHNPSDTLKSNVTNFLNFDSEYGSESDFQGKIRQQQIEFRMERLQHDLYNLNSHQFEEQKQFVERLSLILREKDIERLKDVQLPSLEGFSSKHLSSRTQVYENLVQQNCEEHITEIQNLKLQLQEKMEHINRLEMADNILIRQHKEEIESLKIQNKKIDLDFQNQKLSTTSLQTQNEQLLKSLQDVDTKHKTESSKNLTYAQELQQLKDQKKSLELSIQQREQVMNQKEGNLLTQISELKKQMAEVQAMADLKYQDVERDSAQKLNGYKNLQDRYNILSTNYDNLAVKHTTLQQQHDLLAREKVELTTKLQGIEEANLLQKAEMMDSFKKQELALRKQLKDFEANIQNEKLAKDMEIKRLEQLLASQQENLKNLQSQYEQQLQDMLKLRNDNDSKTMLINDINANIESMKLKFAQERDQKIAQITAQNEANIQALNEQHMLQLQEKHKEIEVLTHKIRTFQIDKMDQMRLEIQNLRIELSSQRFLNNRLQAEISQMMHKSNQGPIVSQKQQLNQTQNARNFNTSLIQQQ